MWLELPKDIEHPLWEGPLELEAEEGLNQVVRNAAAQGIQVSKQEALRSMPVVKIGPPSTWPLREVYSPQKMPPPLRALVAKTDFYLVRLSCSFRPIHKESRVQWARFRVLLIPDSLGHTPITHALYPERVEQVVKHQIHITLSPTLKFSEVEAGGGKGEFGLEYPELQPLVSGSVGGGQDPSWDYTEARGVEVQGTKWMYLLIQAPKGTPTGQAFLDLAADVEMRGFRLPVVVLRTQKQIEDHLRVQLWGR